MKCDCLRQFVIESTILTNLYIVDIFKVTRPMNSVTSLIGLFKQGKSSAFGALVGRFFGYPVDLARRRLGRETPIPQDGEDIAQMVFLELYCAVRQCRPMGDQLSDRTSLRIALATLTRQRIKREWRDHTRQRRDARKTKLAADLAGRGDSAPLEKILDPAASHGQRGIDAQDTVEHLLTLLPSARHRSLAHHLLSGHSIPEIARKMRRSVRTVERCRAEIQAIWRNHPAGQAVL
jgi:DNA-directed RNA polymerase specialized sigma24 family protein